MSRLIALGVLLIAALSFGNAVAAPKDKDEAQQHLQDAMDRAKAFLDKQRAKAGFPPQSDLSGTILKCQRLIEDRRAKILACGRSGLETVAPTSTEDAQTTARAIISMCAQKRQDLISAIVPYCMPQDKAEDASREFMKTMEGDILAIIVARRSAARRRELEKKISPPAKAPPRQPDVNI